MHLFNEYENKNIAFLLSYINQVICGNMDALSSEEMENELMGGKEKLTSAELIALILNKNTDCAENLNLLYEDEDGFMQPIYDENADDIFLPILLTNTDKGWLKYILDDPKADLFLNPEIKRFLCDKLTTIDSPINSKYIDIRKEDNRTNLYAPTYIANFKKICFYLKKQIFIEIETSSGIVDFLGFKIIYNENNESFGLLGYDSVSKDLSMINISEIGLVEKSSFGKFNPQEYQTDSYDKFFTDLLDRHKVAPIILEIMPTRYSSEKNVQKLSRAEDRFSHLFSSFDTVNYINSDNNIISEIRYYDFQYEDILRRILSLGIYARVLKPDYVKDSIIDILKNINR